MKNIIIRSIFFIVLLYYFISCVPAPRYRAEGRSGVHTSIEGKVKKTNDNKKRSNKTVFDKSVMIYKGISSYYGPKFHGKLTANGEVFDMYGITAAHKEMPFNTIVRVTNESNGKSQILRINDRGPYIDNRILDCSFGAAMKLGFVTEGTTNVKIEVIEWGDGKYMHH